MTTKRTLGMAAVAAATLLGAAGAAQAADREFCEEYAHAAIIQVRGGLNNAGCRPLMDGARWSAEYRVHYDWCRGTSVHEAETERNIRRGILNRCAGH
jgi:hypothetical protein